MTSSSRRGWRSRACSSASSRTASIARCLAPAERRAMLRTEADALADRTRERLAGEPETLARFERLLALGRDIGPLTEGHNYWIDRMVQSRLRQLSTRVGRRLAAEGSIERARRRVLPRTRGHHRRPRRADRDLRELVAERRATHARQREILRRGSSGAATSTVRGRRPVRWGADRVGRGGRAAWHRRVRRRRARHRAGRAVAGRLPPDPARRHHRLPVVEPVLGAGLRDRGRPGHEHGWRRSRTPRSSPASSACPPSSASPTRPSSSPMDR